MKHRAVNDTKGHKVGDGRAHEKHVKKVPPSAGTIFYIDRAK
jgi:hypothetical protein